jgi:hypothetical protein
VQEPDDPQNLNRYSYVLNSPQDYTDPNGFFFFFDDLIEIAITVGKAIASAAEAAGTAIANSVGNLTGANAITAATADLAAKTSIWQQAMTAQLAQLGSNAFQALKGVEGAIATLNAAQAAYQSKLIATGVLVAGSLSEGMAAGISRAPGLPKIDKYVKDVQSGKGAYEKSSAANVAKNAGANSWTAGYYRGVRVYQRNDLIDPNRVDKTGKTNLQRMKQGLAPIGPDGNPLQLHHMTQTQSGPLAEVTQTFHQQYGRVLHINPRTIPSGIDRAAFDRFREQYWMDRAKGF